MASAVAGVGQALSTAGTAVGAFLGPLGALAALLAGTAFVAYQKYTSGIQAADKAVVEEARSLTDARSGEPAAML